MDLTQNQQILTLYQPLRQALYDRLRQAQHDSGFKVVKQIAGAISNHIYTIIFTPFIHCASYIRKAIPIHKFNKTQP